MQRVKLYLPENTITVGSKEFLRNRIICIFRSSMGHPLDRNKDVLPLLDVLDRPIAEAKLILTQQAEIHLLPSLVNGIEGNIRDRFRLKILERDSEGAHKNFSIASYLPVKDLLAENEIIVPEIDRFVLAELSSNFRDSDNKLRTVLTRAFTQTLVLQEPEENCYQIQQTVDIF
jgi:hypothetical protein